MARKDQGNLGKVPRLEKELQLAKVLQHSEYRLILGT